jgi:MFS superfamily sulfate permease-like transporter
LPTLAVGVLTIGVMLAGKRWLPRWPAPLLAVVFAVALVYSMDLEGKGVAVVGQVPAGLPRLRWPEFDPEFIMPLLGGALGVALLSFSNAIVVARSFAAKGRYEVDVNQEFIALGACQIAAGLSQGFAIRGADSRTAMNYASGGKSQVSALVAAGMMAAVLVFLTGPLGFLPKAALGAVLIVAAIGLFDVAELLRIWKIDRWEFAVSIITTLGVVALDILDGILMAVLIAILLLLMRVSRPPDAVLGRVSGLKGFHNVLHHEKARTWPDLVLYRFGEALVFFNAPYFKKRVLEMAATHPGIKWFIVDGSTINSVDSTGGSHPGSVIGGPAHARDSARLCQPPNRGSRLAGTLRSTGGTRRWRTISDPQISRGCLRLRRVCRNIGNRNRTIVGNRIRWIPVPATRLTQLPLLGSQPQSVTRNHIDSFWMSSFVLIPS